ncbi:MAG: helix-turn-helix domain-containing protein [Propionibacteriaceae bacterium]|jgi:excisionase family DNA binding protein|nr:helix-turn-helix domain-containing protein [Propionibacteriaceae bacterium]
MADLSKALGIPVATIYDWRTRGKGPRAYRFGKHLKFAVSDVKAWMLSRREGGEK